MMSQSHAPTSSELAERLAALLAAGDHAAIHDLFAQSQSQLEQAQAEALHERLQNADLRLQNSELQVQTSSLQVQASNLQTQTSHVQAQAQKLAQENDDLRDKTQRLETRVKHLTRILYGRKSEKLTKEELGQLILAFGGDDTNASATIPLPLPLEARTDEAPTGDQNPARPKKRRPNHPGRTPLSENLQRVIQEVTVSDEERTCIRCGKAMQPIGFVDHETVEFVPAKLVIHVTRREKLACKCKDCAGDLVTAPRQAPPVATRLGASMLAHLIETKCDDGIPLYRVKDQFSRLGFDLPLNTLYSAWSYALDLLEPVHDVVVGDALDGEVIGLDDTSMPVLDTKKGGHKSKGHLWGMWNAKKKTIAYVFTETWRADEIAPLLQATTGFVQVDDYKGYASEIQDVDGQTYPLVDPALRLGCAMHVRRRFHHALTLGDKRAAPALQWFADLYAIEKQAKEAGMDASARGALRMEKSWPILATFYEWVCTLKPQLGKTSALAQAVRYAQNQRPYLERCFSEGRFEIDNGEIERRLREPCIGRKNFLHAGSAAGAKRLAIAYTLVQTCRALGVCTRDYLLDVLSKLAGGWKIQRICQLTPARWAQDRGFLAVPDQVGEQ